MGAVKNESGKVAVVG